MISLFEFAIEFHFPIRTGYTLDLYGNTRPDFILMDAQFPLKEEGAERKRQIPGIFTQVRAEKSVFCEFSTANRTVQLKNASKKWVGGNMKCKHMFKYTGRSILSKGHKRNGG